MKRTIGSGHKAKKKERRKRGRKGRKEGGKRGGKKKKFFGSHLMP